MRIDERIEKYLVDESMKDFMGYGKKIMIFKKPLKIQEKMNKKLDAGKMTMDVFLKSTKEIIDLLKKDIDKVKDQKEIYELINFMLKSNELFYKKMAARSDEKFYDIITDVGKEIVKEMG